eukprot:9856156-Alexandrium_andersonii.AAC.1
MKLCGVLQGFREVCETVPNIRELCEPVGVSRTFCKAIRCALGTPRTVWGSRKLSEAVGCPREIPR